MKPGDYSLRRDCGFWRLAFAGVPAILEEQTGLIYVATLLREPPDKPIHSLELVRRACACLPAPVIPGEPQSTGGNGLDPVLQQRNLGLDDVEQECALRLKKQELEELLENPDEIEPVKAEALRQLEAIERFAGTSRMRTRDVAVRTSDSARKAIGRFHRRLSESAGNNARPHPALGPFATHLRDYLLVPSGRGGGQGGLRLPGTAGYWTYCPPPGILWQVR